MELSVLQMVLITLGVFFLLGMPVFMSLAISAVVALTFGGYLPMSVIHNSIFDGLNIFPLLAIPCFVIAGTLMEHGNITNQIVDVVKQMVGRMHGGLGITTILACTFFAAISGSGPGTVAAVGTILIPAMIRSGYSKEYAAAVSSSGGTIGLLIPPSNPMIIYSILGNVSVTAMFTAGFIPGFMVGLVMCITAWSMARRKGFRGDENTPPFNLVNFLKTLWKSFFSLMTPFVILGSIYSGLCTPVEAAVLAIAYALFVGIVINRALRPNHIYLALLQGALLCGAVLLIVGTSTLFGKILTFEEAPQRLAAGVMSISQDPKIVLLLIIGVLIILGMFMETLSTIIILVPVLMPMLHMVGIDPIHFGIILVVTNEMALLTPPLGVNLFVASRLANISVERIAVSVLPFLAALLVCILILTFFPDISTWLPYTLGMGQ
ncbi:MAG: TRAP transporter large permease [Desulfomicrobium sp.]|nr:TRAP transporter large permease [Desulfomicrobium sp.]